MGFSAGEPEYIAKVPGIIIAHHHMPKPIFDIPFGKKMGPFSGTAAATVATSLGSTCPSCCIDSWAASGTVLSLTLGSLTPPVRRLKDRSSMARYLRLLCGTVASG